MVTVIGFPSQELISGVTVIVAVIGELPEFVAVNAAILPVPLAAKPMLGVLFVQLYVTPLAMLLVKITASVNSPAHFACAAVSVLTVGLGLTVIVKFSGVPGQVANVGVTVIIPLIGVFVEFVAVKAAILPVPFDAKPIEEFEFTHS